MIMGCIYHMLSEKKPFNPTDYMEVVDPHFHQHKFLLNDKKMFLLTWKFIVTVFH